MAADLQRRGVKAGLPSGRHTGGPAHGDKEQRLHAAVPLKAGAHILGNIRQREVTAHIGVHHMAGYVVVDPSGLQQGIGLLPHHLPDQLAQIGRETDVGKLFPAEVPADFPVFALAAL